jgi:hypothetical protein
MSYDVIAKAQHGSLDFVRGAAASAYGLGGAAFMLPTSARKFLGGETLLDKVEKCIGIDAMASGAKHYGYGFGIGTGLLLVLGEVGLTVDSFIEDTPLWYWGLAATNCLSGMKEMYGFFSKRSVGTSGLERTVE